MEGSIHYAAMQISRRFHTKWSGWSESP